MTLLTLFDYCGTAVFAITGCLVAARRGVDIIGFIWLATVTAIGGGTLRDLIIGRDVFWVMQPLYLYLCLAVGVVMFFIAHWIHRHMHLILWFDAVGLALFAVIGTQIALNAGMNIPVCITMGIITATMGGVFRDLLAGEATLIFRREIYVTAAVLSSVTFLGLTLGGLAETACVAIGVTAGFTLRAMALRYRLMLPGYDWVIAVDGNAPPPPQPDRRHQR